MQPTPLRVDQDRAVFDTQMRSNVAPFYQCGAADGQAVGPQMINPFKNNTLPLLKTHIFFNRGTK